MTLRAALIGCGRIGSLMADDPLMAGDVFTHAEAFVRSPQTELVAVCDIDPALAGQCGARWNAQAYTDLGTMLADAKPDIVSICTPDSTHHLVVGALLTHGGSVRGLLCEKPLAMTVAQGEALVAAAHDARCTLAVAFMRRHARNLRALHDLLASGDLGRVEGVTGWYTKGVLHNGSHWFDLLRMLVGEVDWVEAGNALGESGDDPTIDVTMGLASGGVATLRAARAAAFTLFEMDILTAKGRVRITDSGHAIELFYARPSLRYSGYVELLSEPRDFGDRRDQMLHAVDDLARAVLTGLPPRCTGEDGLAALRIGATAITASRNGERMSLLTKGTEHIS